MSAIDTAIRAAAASISLDAVTKSYGNGLKVIPSLSAELRASEFTVVLGPSGCGKSTLLHMIAGLEHVSGGKIRIGSREVQDLEPKQRGCAMVFQNYALYPHMSVADNIAYSLRVGGMPKAQRIERVRGVATMLGLIDLLNRKPGQLSGGQRQRVAIGRAIVREPNVLLFDEPLSNLDAQLRHDMRVELADLHRRIGATTVFVTHDQVEAMTLADRILILNKGQIEQFDTPKSIYRNPASVFVARFIGSPPMNILPATGDGKLLRLADNQPVAHSSHVGSCQLGIRPEDILVDSGEGTVTGQVAFREDLGSHSVIAVKVGTEMIRVATPFGTDVVDSPDIKLRFPPTRIHLFDPQTGKAIASGIEGIAS
jgi:sn-glycerol 3-phosphate transport system ATP-binding protein